MTRGTVGAVGLGIMGGAMARHLHEAGWEVVGYDHNPGRRREAAEHGIVVVDDVASVARRAAILLLSLPSAEAVLRTAEAIAAAGAPRRIVAEASTLSLKDKLAFARVLVEAGHVPLDCPVSGTGTQARARDLVIYASGDPEAVGAATPVLADVSREVHDLGPFGNGTKMKLVANLLVAIHNVASAEAMVLGVRAGLDPDQVVRLIGTGAGQSRIFQLRAPMMASETYEPPSMKLSVRQKDMDVIGRFAAELGVATPLFTASRPVYDEALALGLGSQDTAAVHRVVARRSGAGDET